MRFVRPLYELVEFSKNLHTIQCHSSLDNTFYPIPTFRRLCLIVVAGVVCFCFCFSLISLTLPAKRGITPVRLKTGAKIVPARQYFIQLVSIAIDSLQDEWIDLFHVVR